MFELLAALGLGAYWTGRVRYDKSKTKKYERAYKKLNDDFEDFLKIYAAPAYMQEEIQKKILSVSPELSDLEEELLNVTGIEPTHTMIKWAYLAKMGKVPDRATLGCYDSYNIFSNDHDLVWKGIGKWSTLSISEMRSARLKFIQWYDKELRSRGMGEKLLCVQYYGQKDAVGNYVFLYGMRKEVSECTGVFPTVFFWESTRICPNNLQGVIEDVWLTK